jgi:hemerythrin-like domain-containing protein
MSAAQALNFAASKGIHHMPVVDGVTLVGLICTCDLIKAPPEGAVAAWMSHPPILLDGQASLQTAAQTMNDCKVGSVVVTLDGHARGIVTRGDLLAADPGMASVLKPCRCGVCGLTRHLSTDDDGNTFCIYCRDQEPNARTRASTASVALAAAAMREEPVEAHPLISLIREHQLIGPLADALEVFANGVKSERGTYDSEDLGLFVRVFQDFADCAHHEKEEAVLLPFLARHGFDWNDGPLAEVRREHRQERYLIEVLSHAAAREERWNSEERRRIAATAEALVEFQRAHLLKENTVLFPAVTQRLEVSELRLLKAELTRFDLQSLRHIPYAELTALAERLIQRYTMPAAHLRREPDASELGG